MRTTRSPRSRIRAPHYPYKANPLWPHERAGEIGELILDAVSGAYFPKIYAFEGPFGLVDGRNGGVVDVDTDQHEVPITMVGPSRPPRV